MTDSAYFIWLIATTVMVVVVLTVGTLAAADLLPRPDRKRGPGEEPRARREATATEQGARELSPRR